MSRFCRDCKHHSTITVPRRRYWTSGMWWWYEEFWHDEHQEQKCTAPQYSLVTGEQWNAGCLADCDAIRRLGNVCGPDGNLWEPKAMGTS